MPIEHLDTKQNRQNSWLSRVLTALLLLALIAAGVLELVPSHYYAISPGEAVAVDPMISVHGSPPLHSKGQLLMTDVAVQEVNHKLEELYWRVRPNVELDPAKAVTGSLSNQQYLQLNDQLMSDSIRKAEVAALSVTRGYKLHFQGAGPEVVFLVPGAPAASRLKVGDVIRAVDGYRTRRADSVSPLVKRHKMGGIVQFQILRKGRILKVGVTAVPSTNGTPTKNGKTPLVGILVQDQIALPVSIRIRPGNIGGPSAGLMFTLGLVQRLTHQDITHGCKVAGTGTMDFDGKVGPIGGAGQKVVAAQSAGAKFFLVPNVPDNANPARAAGTHITVVPVKTLQEALKYLGTVKACG